MSVIDRWLNIRRETDGAATSATSATNANSASESNELDVAKGLRQVATFLADGADVAACRNRVATESAQKTLALNTNVADVASVAGGVNQRPGRPATESYALCCECVLPITERLETWWGGEACHRACGEAAFEREKEGGAYRPREVMARQ